MAIESPPRTLRLDIDREALEANWRALDRLSGKARAGAAVKADCYGLGVDTCVPVLRDAGARDFFVAHWSEVADVARHVLPEQIAVLHGANTAEEAEYARSIGARPVVNSLHQANVWIDSGGGPCHMMVDTGIHRLGIAPSEVAANVIRQLDVQVLMSHLSSADEDTPVNAAQLEAFRALKGQLGAQELSLANSAGIGLNDDFAFDLTRPGLSLYGGVQRPELAEHIRQVAYPKAAIIQVAELRAGDHVGYNGEFTAPDAMRVGTVSLGYADGFLRAWGGKGLALYHEGRSLPLLGKVSMDMVVVDLAAEPDLSVGTWLDVPYDLPRASEATGLSQYELLTILGQRFAR
ncbi:alanine racemase [Erythrobacter litoralis]|uniref:alanine racemase n=1 Tax=Erythrobacter litoralis (strain HTCC2594) TaxID=314225 RepID=Q2NAI0_ERYLH|nr:alanine racemase [Erythrobacter litoralis]ABC63311.1 alanine racemase [Erythrobacter litoralis HTCC2594]